MLGQRPPDGRGLHIRCYSSDFVNNAEKKTQAYEVAMLCTVYMKIGMSVMPVAETTKAPLSDFIATDKGPG
jgi:hypothetical protein